MPRYVLTDSAQDDVREIIEYIRARSPQAAARIRAELRSAMQRLAAFPNIGHLRVDLTDEPLRFWSVYSYLIVYRPEQRPLEVIAVLHGARDVEKVLQRRQ
jgi:plasmid stabilization system protein ParE